MRFGNLNLIHVTKQFLNPFCFHIFQGIKASKNVRVSGRKWEKEGGRGREGAVQCLICIHLMGFSV